MHTADAGVLWTAVSLLFSVGQDEAKWKYVRTYSKVLMTRVNMYRAAWRRQITYDFARRPRPLTMWNRAKACETHTVGILEVPNLHHIPEVNDLLDKSMFKNYMLLVASMKLVCSFSCKPIPRVSLNEHLLLVS